jgi:hypothetical protein
MSTNTIPTFVDYNQLPEPRPVEILTERDRTGDVAGILCEDANQTIFVTDKYPLNDELMLDSTLVKQLSMRDVSTIYVIIDTDVYEFDFHECRRASEITISSRCYRRLPEHRGHIWANIAHRFPSHE